MYLYRPTYAYVMCNEAGLPTVDQTRFGQDWSVTVATYRKSSSMKSLWIRPEQALMMTDVTKMKIKNLDILEK
jgi:hypothetical protein